MIQLAWRFLRFQKQSALAQWYQARTADGRLGNAQDDDRRHGTQAADRALALCHDWRDIGGRHLAAGRLKGLRESIFDTRAGVQGGLSIVDQTTGWPHPQGSKLMPADF